MRANSFRSDVSIITPGYVIQKHPSTGSKILPIRPRPLLTAATLLFADVLGIVFASTLAVLIRFGLEGNFHSHIFLQLWPSASLFLIGYFFSHTYSLTGTSPVEELRKLSFVTTFIFFIIVLALFLTKQLDGHSRLTFMLAWFFSIIFVPSARALLRYVLSSRPWWGVPIVILGAAKTSELIIQKLQGHPGLGLKPIACFDDDSSKHGSSLRGVPVLGTLAEAPIVAKEFGIYHAVVAMPGVVPEQLADLVRRYAYAFHHLLFIPNLFGMTSLHVTAQDISGVMSLHARQNLLLASNRLLKRFLDFCLLIPAGLLALPVIGLAALAVGIVSPGNPFYAQEREGYKGKRIRVWKLRTMYKNADELLKKHLAKHPEAKKEWETYFKLAKDPRILPSIGHLLRKTSLDELPQLWNIARGEMSFVGPRPFPFYHLESFSESFRDLRRSVVPGLTGLWQVSARSEGDLHVQEELDSYYIRNWSIWMDIYLIARTPIAVIFGKGAY